jgi:predicted nucleic acid-binding protein
LIDARQPENSTCRSIFNTAGKPLVTTWACLAEAMYLLDGLGGPPFQDYLWEMWDVGALVFHHHSDDELLRMRVLMKRYDNVPMDLADATLMTVAETTGDRRIFTLDNDFRIYRFDDGGYFDVVP